MTDRTSTQIFSRKQPKQARSADLVASVLDAAAQVLAKEGVRRFTSARVAERAGVSVGSLYQYFPNKAAILFRLQSDEWRQTSQLMRRILEDPRHPPLERLRLWVHAFIRSECEEAALRVSLGDAAPFYRNAPEAQQAKASVEETMSAFLEVAAPAAPAPKRAVAADIVTKTLAEAGRRFSERTRSPEDIGTYADAMADMFCAYLGTLAKVSASPDRTG